MIEKKILYVNWGGLGDHLAFSTLPEIFTNLGYDFYINEKSSFRSQEIYDLVWGTNPYVKGLTSENANCGHIPNWGVNIPVEFDKSLSIHSNIEKIYGINPTNNFPKLYYKPNNLKEYNDYVLIDLNASSVADHSHDINVILNHIDFLKDEKLICVLPESSYGRTVVDLSHIENIKKITTSNIFNYVDLIYSCKKFVSLWSGGAHLSVSIKNDFKNDLIIDCLKVKDLGPSDWGESNKSFFWYDNVNYIIC
jgi:hypothetical protein